MSVSRAGRVWVMAQAELKNVDSSKIVIDVTIVRRRRRIRHIVPSKLLEAR